MTFTKSAFMALYLTFLHKLLQQAEFKKWSPKKFIGETHFLYFYRNKTYDIYKLNILVLLCFQILWGIQEVNSKHYIKTQLNNTALNTTAPCRYALFTFPSINTDEWKFLLRMWLVFIKYTIILKNKYAFILEITIKNYIKNIFFI